MKKKNIAITVIITVSIIFLLSWYIYSATLNVIYTDYIRVVNGLADSAKLKSYVFSSGIFVNISTIVEYINLKVFHLNVQLDMILGVIGLAVSFIPIGIHILEQKSKLKYVTLAVIFAVFISLSKWEMLTNGTGQVHFWAFACFYWYYYLLDQKYRLKNNSNIVNVSLVVLPIVTILFVALFYGAVFAITVLIFFIAYGIARKKYNKLDLIYCLAVFILIAVYSLSMIFAGDNRVAASSMSLSQALASEPKYFLKFFFICFSSDVIGIESAADISNKALCLIGGIIVILYILAGVRYLIKKLYRESLIGGLLLLSGFLNHLIVLYSRWGFQNVRYGASSRYSLQYMPSIIGFTIIAMIDIEVQITHKEKNRKESKDVQVIDNSAAQIAFNKMGGVLLDIIFIAGCAIILYGQTKTSILEIDKIPARKNYQEKLIDIGLRYKDVSKDELALFQTDNNKTFHALELAENEDLNFFYDFSRSDTPKYMNIYSDGWCEQNASIITKTGNNGYVSFDLYYPFEDNCNVSISIEDYNNKFSLVKGDNNIHIKTEKNKVVTIKLESDFVTTLSSEDDRSCSYVISNFSTE